MSRHLALVVAVGIASALLGAPALARPGRSPTIAACALKQSRVPGHTNRRTNIMSCLWPTSIVVHGTARWTTCASTAESVGFCHTGVITISFHSTAGGFQLAPGLVQPDPWGGTYAPAWAAWGLPGTGTYHCEASDVDHGVRSVSYRRTVTLRDQAIGLAVVGGAIRVSNALHPGLRGPLGQSAVDQLGSVSTCALPPLRPSLHTTQADWPGKLVPTTALTGASAVVRIAGTQGHSILAPRVFGLPSGAKLAITFRWSSTITLGPSV